MDVFKPKKKQTKKKLILVEKTPSPPKLKKPKNKITKKTKAKPKTPSPPKTTLKKKLKSPKAKTVKSTKPKVMKEPKRTATVKKPLKLKIKLLLDTDLKISHNEGTVMSIMTEPIEPLQLPTPIPIKARFNEAFIDVLGELADILQRQGEPFKARAYQQAQESIMTFPDDIYTVDQLKGLKGIGKAIESKLEEYSKTGTIKLLERERANPLNVLTRVYGIGPKKAKELIDKGMTTLADLQANPTLLNENQRIGLKYAEAIDTRIPRSEIDEYKQVLDKTFLKATPPGSSYDIVGSYRRGALTSGDIDLIITNQANNPAAFTNFLDQLIKDKIVIEVLSKGKTKSLTIAQLPGKIPRRVDFLYTPPSEYAFAILYFTGSKIFNTVQRQRALTLGYTLNEHGLNHMVQGKKGEPVQAAFPDEKSIFTYLGMQYKEPQERTDGRAVQLLAKTSVDVPEPIPLPIQTAPVQTAPVDEPIIMIKKKQTTLKKKPLVKVDNLSKFKQEGQSALALFTEKDLSKLIRDANNAYYDPDYDLEPLMTDNEYDILREYTLKHYPKNKAAKEGHTKSTIKVEKNKIKLPYEMWSMDKIKPNTDTLLKWKQTYTGPYVISCKLDGISALFSTEKNALKLYTRGNGLIGQDISHLIPYLKLPVKSKDLVIRGEIIIKKLVFESKYAQQFANPRNFVAGQVNQKTIDPTIMADLSFVAYEVIKPVLKPSAQLMLLQDASQTQKDEQAVEVVKHLTLTSTELSNERLSELLIQWRTEYAYEIDGIICIDDNVYPRATGNPGHAFAFKMVLSDQVAEALVTDVIWSPSKDGYLKPRVKIEPLTLGGVTIEYATGFNARFIVDKQIGVGALIRLIRSGDVIPHITEVVQPAAQPLMPTVPYEWNATQVDILLTDKANDATVKEKTISGFFTHLEVDGLGPGNIKRMIEAGYDTVPKILAMNEADFLKVEGFKTKLAQKIHTNIAQQIKKATLPELMHASNLFGRGFGTKKLQLILDAYPTILTDSLPSPTKVEKISTVNGLAQKTAEQFVKEIPAFLSFLQSAHLLEKLTPPPSETLVKPTINVNKDHPLYGKKWVMTGFRDKALIQDLLNVGSEQGTGVNKKTTLVIVKDLEEDNVKVADAQKLGIPIMTPEQVRAKYTF
jgi:DNA ligase (NAD+)